MPQDIEAIRQAAIDKRCCTGTVLPLADALQDAIREREAAKMVVRTLKNHLDEMAHVVHRAYHAGDPGYYFCSMPYCRDTAALLKHLESY